MSAAVGILFDGFAYGMLLFLLSVGLSVTLGLMNFTNLAHGSFAMLGGYVTYALVEQGGWPFLPSVLMSMLAAGLAGLVFERLLFRRFYKAGELDQVLLTVGFVFVAAAAAAYFFGTAQQPVAIPSYLRGSLEVGTITFSIYRLFLIAVAVIVAALLVIGLDHTRFGAQVRAAVDNQRMAEGLGIPVELTFALTFALGSGLAGLGGALAIDVFGLDPTFGLRYLVYMLIVVAVGGLGSVKGSWLAASLLGICDVAGKYFVPQLGSFLIYALMVLLLFVRPSGLFGRR